jgi:hypothetical protein
VPAEPSGAPGCVDGPERTSPAGAIDMFYHASWARYALCSYPGRRLNSRREVDAAPFRRGGEHPTTANERLGVHSVAAGAVAGSIRASPAAATELPRTSFFWAAQRDVQQIRAESHAASISEWLR